METDAELIAQRIRESLAVKEALLRDSEAISQIEIAAAHIVTSLRQGAKVLLFGNGGSAGDSQHIAAELTGRYMRERSGVAALALTVNTSSLTAIAKMCLP